MSDSFLTLNFATDSVGAYPQVQTMRANYDLDGATSIRHLPRYGSLSFEPDLDGFVIESGALLTDLLSCGLGLSGFLISKRLAEVLRGCALQDSYAILPAVMHYRNKELRDEYYLVHAPHLPLVPDGDLSPRQVSEIVSERSPALDIFTLRRPQRLRATYVSPGLVKAIESQGCTGIRFGRSKLRKTS